MKNLGVLLAGGVTILLVLAVGIFSFMPSQPAPATPVAPPSGTVETPEEYVAAPESANGADLQATMAEREAIHQAQIEDLNQALQERQTVYQSQIQEVTTRIATAQNRLNELKAQEQKLLSQVAQLENTRAERLATYQSQLQQAQGQYRQRYTQLQTQLTEARTKLAEANAQLGQ